MSPRHSPETLIVSVWLCERRLVKSPWSWFWMAVSPQSRRSEQHRADCRDESDGHNASFPSQTLASPPLEPLQRHRRPGKGKPKLPADRRTGRLYLGQWSCTVTVEKQIKGWSQNLSNRNPLLLNWDFKRAETRTEFTTQLHWHTGIFPEACFFLSREHSSFREFLSCIKIIIDQNSSKTYKNWTYLTIVRNGTFIFAQTQVGLICGQGRLGVKPLTLRFRENCLINWTTVAQTAAQTVQNMQFIITNKIRLLVQNHMTTETQLCSGCEPPTPLLPGSR